MNKSKYDKLEIPKKLSTVVNDAIETGINKKQNNIKFYNKLITAFVIIIIVFIVPLNTIPLYAKTMQKLPIIGAISKIFTFKEYHFENDIEYIDVKIPQIVNESKTDLEARVNEEIIKTINEEVENRKKIAKEYYDAFIKTGGDPEKFIPVGINIDYEIKCMKDDIVSFVIIKNETYPSAYLKQYFYNLDMESGRVLTLKEWLGNDYKEIVIKNINNTISTWDDQKKSMLWKDLNLEELINENTNFYINEKNEAVVVFEKYEIAVGAAGTLEFPITEK